MKQENIKSLYKLHAKFYDITRPFFLFGRKKALDYIQNIERKKVIDYGCGTGLNYKYLNKKYNNLDYIGIDVSYDMLDVAKSKYKKDIFYFGDITKTKNKSDIAICTYVLSMIDNYEEVIINIKNNLEKNGSLIVLDFYPFKGLLNTIFPILKYLYISGVNPEKPMIKTLEKHFSSVKTHISFFGHHFISICKK